MITGLITALIFGGFWQLWLLYESKRAANTKDGDRSGPAKGDPQIEIGDSVPALSTDSITPRETTPGARVYQPPSGYVPTPRNTWVDAQRRMALELYSKNEVTNQARPGELHEVLLRIQTGILAVCLSCGNLICIKSARDTGYTCPHCGCTYTRPAKT